MLKPYNAPKWRSQSWQYRRSHPYRWGLLVLAIVHLPNVVAAWLTIANFCLPQTPPRCPPEATSTTAPPAPPNTTL